MLARPALDTRRISGTTEALKVYEFTDFAAHPVEYCGVHITDSPTYKNGIEDGIKTPGVAKIDRDAPPK
jgi:hypothetical protein